MAPTAPAIADLRSREWPAEREDVAAAALTVPAELEADGLTVEGGVEGLMLEAAADAEADDTAEEMLEADEDAAPDAEADRDADTPDMLGAAAPTDMGVTVLLAFWALWYQGIPQESATLPTCHPKALALG
jgi:hypothetical protein